MSRPLRLDFPGAYHHVMNRGAASQPIFITDADRERFLEGVDEVTLRWGWRVLCYCLMPNHYHLCVQTAATPLSRLMRHIDGVYTQRYNRAHRRDGPLFRGRYHAKLIEEDVYLLAVARYIHQNPKDLGVPLTPYRWSSLGAYLTGVGPAWLDTNYLLHYFDGSRDRAHAFMENAPSRESVVYDPTRCVTPFFGSPSFHVWLIAQSSLTRDREIPEQRTVAVSVDACLRAVAKVCGEPVTALTQPRRGRAHPARLLAMYACRELGGAPHRQIAARFGVTSYTTVSAACARMRDVLAQDAQLRRQWTQIAQQIHLHYRQPAT